MSIRTRLALIYTGLLAAALIAFGSGVYLALRAELEQSFDASLIANAHHAADALAQDVDATNHLHPSDRLITQFASTGGRILVLDPAGRTLVDSAPAAPPGLSIAAADLAQADRHAHPVREYDAGGDVMRLTVESILSLIHI